MAGFNSRGFWDSVTQGYGLGEKIVGGLTKRHIGNKMAEINAMAPEELPQYEDGVATGTKLYRMGDRTQETAFSPEEVQAFKAENAAKLFDSLGETDKANQYRMTQMQMQSQGLQNKKLKDELERIKRATEIGTNKVNMIGKIYALDQNAPDYQDKLDEIVREGLGEYSKFPDGQNGVLHKDENGNSVVSIYTDSDGRRVGQAPVTRENAIKYIDQMTRAQLAAIHPDMAIRIMGMDQDQFNADRNHNLDVDKFQNLKTQNAWQNKMEEAKFKLIKDKQAYDLDPNNPKTKMDLEESAAKAQYYRSEAGKNGSRTSGLKQPTAQDIKAQMEIEQIINPKLQGEELRAKAYKSLGIPVPDAIHPYADGDDKETPRQPGMIDNLYKLPGYINKGVDAVFPATSPIPQTAGGYGSTRPKLGNK